MSRLTRHKLQLAIERVDLREVVAHAVEATRQQIEAREHHLTVRSPDAAVCVDGDPVRLAPVILNLVANAAKVTPPRGHVMVTLAREGAQAALTVTDDGIGIAAESLPTIFEPFTQGAQVEHTERGLGVGLALVHGLVGAHGGHVSVTSRGA